MAWKADERLAEDLNKYVAQNLKILNFVQREYDEYRWSLPSLDRNHIDPVLTFGAEGSKRSPNKHRPSAKHKAKFNVKTICLHLFSMD